MIELVVIFYIALLLVFSIAASHLESGIGMGDHLRLIHKTLNKQAFGPIQPSSDG